MNKFYDTHQLKDRVIHSFNKKSPDPVLLIGPTGCGKTTLIYNIATETQQQIEEVIAHEDITASDFIGHYLITRSGSQFVDGPLVRAMKQGYIFYLDEINAMPRHVLQTLFSALDFRRQISIPSIPQPVKAAPGFQFVAAYNPSHELALPTAFKQRCRCIEFDYLAKKDEIYLIVEQTGVNKKIATTLVDIAIVTRTKIEHTPFQGISTRLLIMAAKALKDKNCFEYVIQDYLINPLTDDPELKTNILTSLQVNGLISNENLNLLQFNHRLNEEPITDTEFADLNL